MTIIPSSASSCSTRFGAERAALEPAVAEQPDHRDALHVVGLGELRLSSMFTFTNRYEPWRIRDICSITGATWRHGWHHGAQKSTITGSSDSTTSALPFRRGDRFDRFHRVVGHRFVGSLPRTYLCEPRGRVAHAVERHVVLHRVLAEHHRHSPPLQIAHDSTGALHWHERVVCAVLDEHRHRSHRVRVEVDRLEGRHRGTQCEHRDRTVLRAPTQAQRQADARALREASEHTRRTLVAERLALLVDQLVEHVTRRAEAVGQRLGVEGCEVVPRVARCALHRQWASWQHRGELAVGIEVRQQAGRGRARRRRSRARAAAAVRRPTR